jgi:hypothetical protein
MAVEIAGQSGLRVFGYPHQNLLRDNAREMIVGPELDELVPRARILVPTLPAYVAGKLLSSAGRPTRAKRAKDLAYVSDLLSQEPMRTAIITELPALCMKYPKEAQLPAQSPAATGIPMRLGPHTPDLGEVHAVTLSGLLLRPQRLRRIGAPGAPRR